MYPALAGRPPASFPHLTTLRLVRDVSLPLPAGHTEEWAARPMLHGPADVLRYMAPFAAYEVVEVIWLLPLTVRHQLATVGPVVVNRGILTSAPVHPREIFLSAIAAQAVGIIVVHNHPSGDPTPSAEDRAVTEQLAAAGRLLDIPLLDHVIVGGRRYFSMAEQFGV